MQIMKDTLDRWELFLLYEKNIEPRAATENEEATKRSSKKKAIAVIVRSCEENADVNLKKLENQERIVSPRYAVASSEFENRLWK